MSAPEHMISRFPRCTRTHPEGVRNQQGASSMGGGCDLERKLLAMKRARSRLEVRFLANPSRDCHEIVARFSQRPVVDASRGGQRNRETLLPLCTLSFLECHS